MKFAVIAISGLLAGCGGTIVKDHPVTVKVPVVVPCKAAMPARVVPLREQFTDEQWAALDVKQRAALVGKAGLDRLTYGEKLEAATAGCP